MAELFETKEFRVIYGWFLTLCTTSIRNKAYQAGAISYSQKQTLDALASQGPETHNAKLLDMVREADSREAFKHLCEAVKALGEAYEPKYRQLMGILGLVKASPAEAHDLSAPLAPEPAPVHLAVQSPSQYSFTDSRSKFPARTQAASPPEVDRPPARESPLSQPSVSSQANSTLARPWATGMSPIHQVVLRNCRVEIIANLDVKDHVLERMYAVYILPQHSRDHLDALTSPRHRALYLLDMLPSCGRNAFRSFIEALEGGQNETHKNLAVFLLAQEQVVTDLQGGIESLQLVRRSH